MMRLTVAQCATLVESIDEVIDSHTKLILLLRAMEPEDTKKYAEYRVACRAALAHLEHILKIIGITGDPDDGARQRASAALAEARAEIGAARAEEATGDGEGRIG